LTVSTNFQYDVAAIGMTGAAGARFDRFGIMNVRKGGKYVTMYLDDLQYTGRRAPKHRPVRHEEKTVVVLYPPDGQKY
jgi:hypothetical protein